MTTVSQFFQAVQAGDENTVNALLAADPSLATAHGADLHARTSDAQTALSLAEARGHKEAAEFLRMRGAA